MRRSDNQKRAELVYERLLERYPDARCTLDIESPERFLFINILSPQCTDKVANRVAVALWDKYANVNEIADAPINELERVIHDCGMYRVKARHIKATAMLLVTKFNGKVPKNLDQLQEFPGIGRKTGLVIMQELFGEVHGIIIDTHNVRIAQRIGLTKEKDPVKIERDLMEIVPKKYWSLWSHLMVFHGRDLCPARNPKCDKCPIADVCEYGQKAIEET